MSKKLHTKMNAAVRWNTSARLWTRRVKAFAFVSNASVATAVAAAKVKYFAPKKRESKRNSTSTVRRLVSLLLQQKKQNPSSEQERDLLSRQEAECLPEQEPNGLSGQEFSSFFSRKKQRPRPGPREEAQRFLILNILIHEASIEGSPRSATVWCVDTYSVLLPVRPRDDRKSEESNGIHTVCVVYKHESLLSKYCVFTASSSSEEDGLSA